MNFKTAFKLAEHLPKSMCVVCRDDKNAQQLTAYLKLLVGRSNKIAYLPSPQTLLYEELEPSPAIVAQRLETLYAWSSQDLDCIVMSINTFIRPMPKPEFIGQNCLKFSVNDKVNPSILRTNLQSWNYEYADFVCDPGTFAIRGSIIDIYPFHADAAIRIELFDDIIEKIYSLDKNDLHELTQVNIFPDKEYSLDDASIANFTNKWQKNFGLWGQKSEIYKKTAKAKVYAGLHQWLQWLSPDSCWWPEYRRAEYLFIEPEVLLEFGKTFAFASQFYENHKAIATNPLLPISDLIMTESVLNQHLAFYNKLPVEKALTSNFKAELILFDSLHEAEANASSKKGQLLKLSGDLYNWLKTPQTGIFTAHALIHIEPTIIGKVKIQTAAATEKTQKTTKKSPQEFTNKLKIGSIVVHPKYGIGKLTDITAIEHSGEVYDCVEISYANSGKVFVPITELDQLSKFKELEADSDIKLSTLGKKSWQQKQAKAIKKIVDDAASLLKLHAARKQQARPTYKLDQSAFAEFLARFPFEDTVDQAKITKIIVDDLTQKHYPMERLICGDVGFGKTEIALRASWLAVSNNKQVVWLAPTTILAKQHANRMRERFHQDCFTILECIGGKKTAEQDLAQLKAGKIDLVVGTHSVLNKSLEFANLGLIVIDEEHKFGVKQKDALAQRYPLIDILSLSATPIPRSLNMAMSSLRDISLLASPPAERLDIKTFVSTINDDELIHQAILREVQRGGQIYFCYNRIEKLADKKTELKKWFPEINIEIVHGQMTRELINSRMQDFGLQKIDLLLCSSIVESGLDFANANTLIVYRADLFGLSQLHQLRGRVGRGKQQAYAYFLVPEVEHQTKDCQARIQAIQNNSGLGSGFALAIEDLEIRGAGNLLGKQQSGHILEMGFQHYIKLLNQTMEWLKAHPKQDLDIEEILANKEFSYNVPFSTCIPDCYILEPDARLSCYQELAMCESHAKIDQLRLEWLKRYGEYPEAVANLLDLAHIKCDLTQLGAISLDYDANARSIALCFFEQALSDAQVQKLLTKPGKYLLRPDARLMILQVTHLRNSIADLCLELS